MVTQEDLLGPAGQPIILNPTRIKDITIKNKAVKKIEIDGKVFWEKYLPASILLESDPSVASVGDTINLTATVFDKFNRGCPDKRVDFINADTITMDTFTTDNNNMSMAQGNNAIVFEIQNDDGNVIYPEIFLNDSRFIEFTIDSLETEDVAYLQLFNTNDVHLTAQHFELQEGKYTLIYTSRTPGISVLFNNEYIGSLNDNSGTGFKIGFYISEAQISLSNFEEHEYIGYSITDSNGETSTVSYYVKDTLPLNIKAIFNNIHSNNITLTNVAYEDPLTSKTFDWICKSSYGTTTPTYSSEGCKATSVCRLSTPILTESTKWKMELEMKPSNTNRVCVGVGYQDFGNAVMFMTDVGNTNGFNRNVYTTSWNSICIIRDGNDYYAIINGYTSSIISRSDVPNCLLIWKWGGGDMIVRNLKVTLI